MNKDRVITITFVDGTSRTFNDGWNYKINNPEATGCLKLFLGNETYIYPMQQIASLYLKM